MNAFFMIPEFFLLLNLLFLISFILGKTINITSFLISKVQSSDNAFILSNVIDFCIFSFYCLLILVYNLKDEISYFSYFSFFSSKFISFSKLLIIFFMILILYIAKNYFKDEFIFKSTEFFVFLSISSLSMLFLISSNDFLNLYLALELQSLSLYILAGFKQTSILSIEAGLKYFILGSFSSALFIFGISLIYGASGITNFLDLQIFLDQNQYFENRIFIFLGILLIICTLFFKFTAVPFHMWAPDVYEGCSTLVTFYFSTVPKIVFYVLLSKLFNGVFLSYSSVYINIFYFCSIFSLLLGSFSTLHQNKLKRFLAYSSISNIGFFLMTLILSSIENVLSGLFYLIIYLITLSGVFFFLLNTRYFNSNLKLKNMNEFLGFLNNNFLYLLFFLINFFSFLGMPPTSGFIGKFFLFLNAISNEFILLFLIACFSTIFTTVIYLKIIRLLFFNRDSYFYFYSPLSRLFLIFSFFIFFLNFLIFFDSNNFIVFFSYFNIVD